MAEDSDLEKTEPASPRRLEKAREEGQVVRSRELNTFLLLAAGVAGLWFTGAHLYRELSGVLHSGLWFDPRAATDTSVMLAVAASSAFQALLALLPLFVLLAVTAVLASVLLGGFLLSAKALEPKFERMNVLKGLKRMVSAQTLVELIKTLAKAALIGSIGASVIWHYHDRMIALMHATASEALTSGMELVALCCGLIVASLLLVVLIDAPWQLFSHFKKLRMSRQDVKQEHKESEGDPHVKGRIRQQQRAMARRRMMAEVPKADVVVTNPTHYAVALSYAEGGTGAPRVVAKGTNLIAATIRRLAEENRVPVLHAPPLARALHAHVELGREIPVELYSAVARVLAWVYQLKRWETGVGSAPDAPGDLPVPAGFDPLQAKP
ncbi:flagellar biosynthesis protein FlhB [Paracandidimonas soli]|uniref:Flagellar biosynthetic protein FlhB n=1 Tax=Paracandidimonas soli TaxID=1917182 RepID=A0A4R3VB53_9BURK|nr:flagellar biosynthesis protein FlhB [Paracandidimonas soli]TCV00798.1 flagellar biosynthetic protein FlhB [Paracandidimonas soli]